MVVKITYDNGDFLETTDYTILNGTNLQCGEQKIIIHRYGLCGCEPKTQREVASYLGISRSYVSRIEKKALFTLKAAYGDVRPDFDD